MRKSMIGCLTVLCGIWAGFSAFTAMAQGAYPSKSVTLVLPFPPGGSTDIVARTIQPKLSGLLGQPVLWTIAPVQPG